MADTRFRYPGAQPFRDDELARQTFFGREAAVVALTNQILANRLVVVYAKSGAGKTSLLNAGVAPRLRNANTVPLFLRLNDVEHEIRTSVFEQIRSETTRQKVEYVAGTTSSLWTFFKTAQFWRGDILLTPVLILDQFEELFTLQSDEQRENFLSELSYVIRGVPPPSLSPDLNLSDTPPPLHVVLSLREDFLGLLEEGSDRIPQILDNRFRLAPLDRETAALAITGPAQIDDATFATRPFRFDPDVVPAILNYLTKTTTIGRRSSGCNIEPFHLQLICQRIERTVAEKQKASSATVQFSFQDLGGEATLATTLAGFYEDAILSLHGMRLRRAARRMCEEYLISPEGRRLSVDERELQSQLNLPFEALRQLMDRRLLRTDRRADTTYYELSHDALVQPVLDSRRTQALVVGWVAVLAGSTVSFVTVAVIVLVMMAAAGLFGKLGGDALLGMVLIAIVAAAIGSFSIRWLRAGMRTRRRYGRRAPREAIQEPTIVPLTRKLLGYVSLVTGSAICSFYSVAGLVSVVCVGALFSGHGHLPRWLSSVGSSLDVVYQRPFFEIFWGIAELATIILFGWVLLRVGVRRLWQVQPRRLVPAVGATRSIFAALVKLLGSALAFLVAASGALSLRQCVTTYQGQLPTWLPRRLIGSDFWDGCRTLYTTGWDFTSFTVALFFLSAFAFSIVLLRNGLPALRNALDQRRQHLTHDRETAATHSTS